MDTRLDLQLAACTCCTDGLARRAKCTVADVSCQYKSLQEQSNLPVFIASSRATGINHKFISYICSVNYLLEHSLSSRAAANVSCSRTAPSLWPATGQTAALQADASPDTRKALSSESCREPELQTTAADTVSIGQLCLAWLSTHVQPTSPVDCAAQGSRRAALGCRGRTHKLPEKVTQEPLNNC